jgi:hypothetical protein
MRDIIDRLTEILESQALDEAPDEVRDAIRQRIEKIPNEQDLVDVLKFTKKYTLKKDVEKFTTLRNYKDLVSSVFLRALADTDLPAPDAEQRALKKDYSAEPHDHVVLKNAYRSDFTVAGGKTPPARTTNDLPQGTKSPMTTIKRPPKPATGANPRG